MHKLKQVAAFVALATLSAGAFAQSAAYTGGQAVGSVPAGHSRCGFDQVILGEQVSTQRTVSEAATMPAGQPLSALACLDSIKQGTDGIQMKVPTYSSIMNSVINQIKNMVCNAASTAINKASNDVNINRDLPYGLGRVGTNGAVINPTVNVPISSSGSYSPYHPNTISIPTQGQ